MVKDGDFQVSSNNQQLMLCERKVESGIELKMVFQRMHSTRYGTFLHMGSVFKIYIH